MPISVPTFSRRRSGAGPTGLDLDGGYVSAVTLGDRAVASAASAELPPGVIAEGEVRDAGALSDALRRFRLLDAMLDQETPVGAEVVGDAVL
jgi:Tfp pilus assembly PilM family ATPase